MGYENRKLVSDVGHKGADRRTSPAWAEIRAWSVLEFVNRVSSRLGASTDRRLCEQLFRIALDDGEGVVEFAGFTYTGPMLLELYYRDRRDEDEFKPFVSRKDWDEFVDAMRSLRDPSIPMIARGSLLKMGEKIEARQRTHAESRGWI